MTGLARIIFATARRKTLRGRGEGNSALCAAGPGATIPRASAFRSATGLLEPAGDSTTAFVAVWKWLAHDPCFVSLDVI